MVTLVIAGILLPVIGSLFVLVIPRSWVKWFSQAVALLAVLCALIVLIEFASNGKAAITIDLLSVGNLLIYGVVIDKVSTLISTAFIIIGLLTVVYSGGY